MSNKRLFNEVNVDVSRVVVPCAASPLVAIPILASLRSSSPAFLAALETAQVALPCRPEQLGIPNPNDWAVGGLKPLDLIGFRKSLLCWFSTNPVVRLLYAAFIIRLGAEA
jgi:hypothetical protein